TKPRVNRCAHCGLRWLEQTTNSLWWRRVERPEDTLLDPHREAAKIRAFFVHPEWARHGIGSIILDACESAAKASGFGQLEMGATLTGVPFYRARNYVELESIQVPLRDGLSLPIIRMAKSI